MNTNEQEIIRVFPSESMKSVSKNRTIMAEVDLGRSIVVWLREQGWTVYQEVEIFTHGARADIVAVIEPKIWIIEVKLSHGMNVLEQASHWLWLAHYVSVAVPFKRCGHGHVAHLIHQTTGIGLLHGDAGGHVSEEISPRLNRRAEIKRVREALRDEHMIWCEAGSNNGGYYSNFNATKRKLIDLVNKTPGLTMKEIITELGRCHYISSQTARCALAQWIRKGAIKGVERQKEGRFVRYYPSDCNSVNPVPSVAENER